MSDEKKIAEGFLPHTHAEMMRELKFKEPCFAVIYADGMVMTGNEKWVDIMLRKDPSCIKGILYQQAQKWIWDKHKVWFVPICEGGKFMFKIKLKGFEDKRTEWYGSVIHAQNEGILKAIKHLHLNHKK